MGSKDTPLANVTEEECEEACDNSSACVGFTRKYDRHNYHNPYGVCYLRSQVNLTQCVTSRSGYETYTQAAPPALTGNIVYHLFERKYTGLANKDAGDFKGDTGFIFNTFNSWSKGNPEASMEHNIIEMSEINVTGWGRYEECNAPGAEGMFNCPSNQQDYCCTHHDPANHSHNIPAVHTADQLPGLEVNKESLGSQYGFGGWWFSFPKESQGNTWTEKLIRRIDGKCMGNAWRKDAGVCDACNATLDSCVAKCIKAALCKEGSTVLLQATWDRVFADPQECPDVHVSDDDAMMVV